MVDAEGSPRMELCSSRFLFTPVVPIIVMQQFLLIVFDLTHGKHYFWDGLGFQLGFVLCCSFSVNFCGGIRIQGLSWIRGPVSFVLGQGVFLLIHLRILNSGKWCFGGKG
jgi:hypothetical protein